MIVARIKYRKQENDKGRSWRDGRRERKHDVEQEESNTGKFLAKALIFQRTYKTCWNSSAICKSQQGFESMTFIERVFNSQNYES